MPTSRVVILAVLPLAALALAAWLLLVSPKRQEASELTSEATALQAQVSEQEQLAQSAETARQEFPRAYRRLVVLGKAAPEDDDTSSFLIQLERIASQSGVDFVSLQAESGAAGAPAPPPPEAPAEEEETTENVASETPAPPTEAQASLLPIGASIGPAGLAVLHYSLNFEGDFFKLAEFLQGIDGMVRTRADGDVGVQGRLVTVDNFELTPLADEVAATTASGQPPGMDSNPNLKAEFTITTYLTPADEGTVAGASPEGPAPPTEPQPASTPPASADPTATASTGTP
jgi:hypothetical protein